MKSKCPVCDKGINLPSGIILSEIITCPDCKSKLEVVSVDKTNVELKEAPQVEEDWGQ